MPDNPRALSGYLLQLMKQWPTQMIADDCKLCCEEDYSQRPQQDAGRGDSRIPGGDLFALSILEPTVCSYKVVKCTLPYRYTTLLDHIVLL